VASTPAAANGTAGQAAARGQQGQQFLNWTIVRDAGCEDVLTATTLVGDTRAGAGGVPSLEFGVAELGWWLDGTCAAGGSHRCAANATCQDVETPSGAWGHRCACRDGTTGDGFAAGEGCRYRAGEFSSPVLSMHEFTEDPTGALVCGPRRGHVSRTPRKVLGAVKSCASYLIIVHTH
jgi:hypothetical protein